MTEKRIREILLENDAYLTIANVEAMKQAVNEALEEAAEITDQPQYILNLMVK